MPDVFVAPGIAACVFGAIAAIKLISVCDALSALSQPMN
jgi:hypothetical protein